MLRFAALIVLGALLALSTSARASVWSDERRIWQEAVAVSPLKPRPWVNLGRQFALQGADGLAADCFRRAVALSAAPGRPLEERRDGVRIAQANLDRLSFDLLTWLALPL